MDPVKIYTNNVKLEKTIGCEIVSKEPSLKMLLGLPDYSSEFWVEILAINHFRLISHSF